MPSSNSSDGPPPKERTESVIVATVTAALDGYELKQGWHIRPHEGFRRWAVWATKSGGNAVVVEGRDRSRSKAYKKCVKALARYLKEQQG